MLKPGAVKRTSSLKAPIMLLTGHEGEVFSSRFSPDGKAVASASFDRQIYLWSTQGECRNYAALLGHAGAVLDVHWNSDGDRLLSASTDKTCAVWDADQGTRIRRLRGHTSFVNSCCPAKDSFDVVTGSDDGTIKLWDQRRRPYVSSLANKYQVTSVCYGATTDTVITGGLDNMVKVWDTRKMAVLYEMSGHADTVTGLKLSPDGTHVLSNGMDNTVRMWDVRPYAKQRLAKTFVGAQHGFEKNLIKCSWTPDGKHVAAGSADRNVYIWNVASGAIKYKLPGHTGSVNDVDFHPSEPIIVSGASDRKLYLGELEL
jgi:Prp8 binding protein